MLALPRAGKRPRPHGVVIVGVRVVRVGLAVIVRMIVPMIMRMIVMMVMTF